jgi:hypothetical protein
VLNSSEPCEHYGTANSGSPYSDLPVVVVWIEQLIELVVVKGAVASSLIDVGDAHLNGPRLRHLYPWQEAEMRRQGLASRSVLLIAEAHVVTTYTVFKTRWRYGTCASISKFIDNR